MPLGRKKELILVEIVDLFFCTSTLSSVSITPRGTQVWFQLTQLMLWIFRSHVDYAL